jgi:preprotein translocase subunit SecD
LAKGLTRKVYLDRDIIIDSNAGRIIIRIPWAEGQEISIPDKTLEKIGRTALLTFQEVDEDKVDSDGKYLPTGKIIVQGTDVVDATAVMDPNTGKMMVDA